MALRGVVLQRRRVLPQKLDIWSQEELRSATAWTACTAWTPTTATQVLLHPSTLHELDMDKKDKKTMGNEMFQKGKMLQLLR